MDCQELKRLLDETCKFHEKDPIIKEVQKLNCVYFWKQFNKYCITMARRQSNGAKFAQRTCGTHLSN